MAKRHGRNVEIQWVDVGGTSKILKDLESRFDSSPDAPGVDLLFGGGVAPYLTAVEHAGLRDGSAVWHFGCDPANLRGIECVRSGASLVWCGSHGIRDHLQQAILQKLGLKAPQNWTILASPSTSHGSHRAIRAPAVLFTYPMKSSFKPTI